MKRDKPAPRKPAASSEADKPIVSRRFATVASIVIVIALILALYLLATGMRPGTANPYTPPTQQPQQEKWEPSPLVAQYMPTARKRLGIQNDAVNVTPIVVINCRYVVTGSFALDEEREVVPAGSERDNLGNALCVATHKSVFCSQFSGAPKGLVVTDFQDCSSGGKTIIYALHSPTCLISSAQRNVLDALRDEFSGDINLEYICTPRGSQDVSLCKQQFSSGGYNQ
jgi:hypothetical protein